MKNKVLSGLKDLTGLIGKKEEIKVNEDLFNVEQAIKNQKDGEKTLQGIKPESNTYKILKTCIDNKKTFDDWEFQRNLDSICANKNIKLY